MNPAPSVIFFTSASGAGYGLLFVAGLLLATGVFPGGRDAALAALALAFVLIAAGLVSSTMHLGRPERAWRAFSQWRTSWLSREGVLAVATFVPHLSLIGLLLRDADQAALLRAMALASAAGAVLTVTATAMIYASLRAVRHWHHRLVPPVYLSLGLATGMLWLLAVVRLAGHDGFAAAAAACLALALAWGLKLAYWRSVDAGSNSASRSTATSLSGEVRVLDPPHTESNYLLDEMGFRVARRHARRLRRIALINGALLPIALTVVQAWWAPLALLAALTASVGVVVERWLFFAEAEHTVTLYYR